MTWHKKKISGLKSRMDRRNIPLPIANGMKKRRFRFPIGKNANAGKSVKIANALYSRSCI